VRRLSASRSSLLLWCALAAGGCGFGDNGATPDGGVDGTGPAPDTMPDMMPANPLCFGPMGWQLCLDALPSGVVTLTGTLDTDRSDVSPSNPCLKNQPTSWTNSLQPDACIVVGDKVTVTSLVATGKRPLVIIGGSAIAAVQGITHGSIVGGVIAAAGAIPACYGMWKGIQQETQGTLALSVTAVMASLAIGGALIVLRIISLLR